MVGGHRVAADVYGHAQGQRLLAALLLSRPRGVERAVLRDLLWTRKLPRDPKSGLNSALSRVRHGLGLCIAGGEVVSIAAGTEVLVDADIPAARLSEAEAAYGDGDLSRALAAARTGLDALAEPLLPGFDHLWFEPFHAERHALRRRLLRLAVELALRVRGAALEPALDDALRLVADDPLSESAAGLLMDVHAARGDVAKALTAYEEVRVRLRDIDVKVSRPLADRHMQLLVGDRDAPPLAAVEDRRGFVGRDAELETLRREWEAARDGRWHVVLLEGEAGVGKTRLVDRFAEALDERHVLRGRCDEDPIVPFQPFVEAFAHPDALTDAAPDEHLHALAPLMPQRSGGEVPLKGIPPDVQRFMMFEAVSLRLELWTRARPLLLVLNDLHWADLPTIKLLHHLVPRELRLLVVATRRSEEPLSPACAHLLDELRRANRLVRLNLDGLTREETGALVRSGLEDASESFSAELWAETDGNPLFIEEVVRAVAESGATEAPTADTVRRIGAPEGIQSVIVRRLRTLPGTATDALGVAAVIGPDFDLRLVAAVRELELEVVLDTLDRALARGLIVERESYRYQFNHGIVRQAVYQDLGPTRQAHLHQRLATLLARSGERPGLAAEIANHLERAGDVDPELLIGYQRAAAQEAARAFAWEEAADYYALAAASLARLGEEREAERCAEVLHQARALGGAGVSHDARRLFLEMATNAEARGDVDQLVRAALGLGQRYWEANHEEQRRHREILRRALAVLPACDDRRRVWLLAQLAGQLAFLSSGEDEDPIAVSSQAVAMAERLGSARELQIAYMARHAALLHVAHAERRLELIDGILEWSRESPPHAAEARLWRVYDLCELGSMDEARAESERVSALAHWLPLPVVKFVAVGWESLFSELAGDVATTERLATELRRLGEHVQLYDARSVYVAKLFALYRWLGRLDELREEVEELERDGSIAHSAWLAALSLHRVLVGDRREGLASARRLVSGLERVPRDFFWLSTTTVIAEAIAVCRDEESAPALYEALSPYADRFTTHSFGASWGSVQRTLGLLADVMGHEHRATQHLRLALAANTAIKAPVLVAITKCDYGELLARTGHLEPARELGEEAERAAREHGLPVLEERAARLAGLPHTRSIGARN